MPSGNSSLAAIAPAVIKHIVAGIDELASIDDDMTFFHWVDREGDWFLENVDDSVWKAHDVLDQYSLWMTRAAYQRLVGDTGFRETIAGFRALRDDIAALAPGTTTS